MDLKKTGRLIAKKRKAMGLTQGALSEKLNVTPQAVHLWETGQRYPDSASQIMIHKELGLNPVELITGLEMFDEDLKHDIANHMSRIDEKVFVSGNATDEDGNEFYLDLSEYLVATSDKDGNLSDKLIPYTDYHNVEPPKDKRPEEPKTPYNPAKIYLNSGDCILVVSVEMLMKMGKPLYFSILRDRKHGSLIIAFTDKMAEDGFDIPEKAYSGKWKGIHVYGGEFGHALCVEMGVRHYWDLLESMPEIDVDNKVIAITLDELKRSTDDIVYSDFLLPQWQYDAMAEEDEWDEEDEAQNE